MKAIILLSLAFILIGCSNNEESEDGISPYPGGKGCCEKPVK